MHPEQPDRARDTPKTKPMAQPTIFGTGSLRYVLVTLLILSLMLSGFVVKSGWPWYLTSWKAYGGWFISLSRPWVLIRTVFWVVALTIGLKILIPSIQEVIVKIRDRWVNPSRSELARPGLIVVLGMSALLSLALLTALTPFADILRWTGTRLGWEQDGKNGPFLRDALIAFGALVTIAFAYWRAKQNDEKNLIDDDRRSLESQRLTTETFRQSIEMLSATTETIVGNDEDEGGKGGGTLGPRMPGDPIRNHQARDVAKNVARPNTRKIPALEQRIGAMEALQQIAIQEFKEMEKSEKAFGSGSYRSSIISILSTYIINNAQETARKTIDGHFRSLGTDVRKAFDVLRNLVFMGRGRKYAWKGSVDFRHAKFSFLDMEEIFGRGHPLMPLNLEMADLRWANLDAANLYGANLRAANIEGASLRSADLQCACLDSANIQHADLSCVNLKFASLLCADLKWANLFAAQLIGSNLGASTLDAVNLTGATIVGAGLWRAELRCADLENAYLQGANFFEADLQGANLQNAEIKGASFSRAKVSLSDWRGVDFTTINLEELRENVLNDQGPGCTKVVKEKFIALMDEIGKRQSSLEFQGHGTSDAPRLCHDSRELEEMGYCREPHDFMRDLRASLEHLLAGSCLQENDKPWIKERLATTVSIHH